MNESDDNVVTFINNLLIYSIDNDNQCNGRGPRPA